MLALTGAELVDSLWTAISVVSTFGPSPTMGHSATPTSSGASVSSS